MTGLISHPRITGFLIATAAAASALPSPALAQEEVTLTLAQCVALDGALREANSAATALALAQSNYDAATAKEAAAQTALSDAETALQDAEDALEAKREEILNSGEYAQATADLAAAEDAVATANTRIAEAKTAVAQAEAAQNEAKAARDTAASELADATFAEDAARSALNQAKSTLSAATAQRDQLAQEAASAAAEEDELTNEAQTIAADISSTTDSIATAENNLTAAQSSLATAQNTLATAQQQLDASRQEAQAQIDLGSLGFFEKMNSTNAVRLLTTERYASTGEAMLQDTHMGAEGDATSLANMAHVLQYIEETNTRRVRDGGVNGEQLDALLVADDVMALAQGNANWSRIYARGHSKNYADYGGWRGENLAWGAENPLIMLYDDEKHAYDNNTGGETGHYENIVTPQFKVIGMGRTQTSDTSYGLVYSQLFWDGTTDGAYTLERYTQRFNNYYLPLKDQADNGSAETQEAVARALDVVNIAQSNVESDTDFLTSLNTQLASLKTQQQANQTALATNAAKQQQLASDLAAAEDAVTAATTDVESAENNLASAQVVAEAAATTAQETTNAATAAETATSETRAELAAAQNALTDAENAREAAQAALDTTPALAPYVSDVDAATADVAKAETAVTQASAAAQAASTALSTATAANTEAAADLAAIEASAGLGDITKLPASCTAVPTPNDDEAGDGQSDGNQPGDNDSSGSSSSSSSDSDEEGLGEEEIAGIVFALLVVLAILSRAQEIIAMVQTM
ncbi:MAG: hypothetical protein SPI77_01095 [Corynebacterium sp.]|nr:hypothetical protein [Corynebacterium sp.]